MRKEAPALTMRSKTNRSRVTNGQELLPGVDMRQKNARRYRDICAALVVDAAGLDHCSEARLQLIRRFSAAAVMAEQLEANLANGAQIDVQEHCLLSSTLTRLAQRIGIDRRSKIIGSTLSDYLDSKVEEAEPITEDVE
jgi:hypothetical protein